MGNARKLTGALAAILLLAPVATAQVIDCTGGCTTTNYGLGHPGDRAFRSRTNDAFAFTHEDFQGSYIWIQNSVVSINNPECGPERNFAPYAGQVPIREQTGCVPTAEFPVCDSGDRAGQECTAVGFALEQDCPGGGFCDPAGGCPIEIPNDLGGGQENDAAVASGIYSDRPGVFQLRSSSSASFNDFSPAVDGDGNVCLDENRRLAEQGFTATQGWRFNLPVSRGGGNGETYIRFHGDPQKGLYRFDDDGTFCCTSTSGAICGGISEGFNEYPDLYTRNCSIPDRGYLIIRTNDWIFDGDEALPPWGKFETDREHEVPGQQRGLCLENRFFHCETNRVGAVNPCDDDTCNTQTGLCNLLGAQGLTCETDADCDLNDVCDVRERGFRNARPLNEDTDADGIDDTLSINVCPGNPTVLRGVPGQYCTVVENYATVGAPGTPAGDPGPDCAVWNFGARPLPDDDCNGIDDRTENGGLGDFCEFLNEYDPFADGNGDCTDGDPATPCRGDECECGDHDESGSIDINDILGVNRVIFGLELRNPIGDSNNDLKIDILDILATNGEIFTPNTSTCRQVTRLACGDGAFQLGEACDDGNLDNLDGCDTGCRVELGWACTSPTGLCGGTATACTLPENCDGIGDGTCVYDTPSVCGLIP